MLMIAVMLVPLSAGLLHNRASRQDNRKTEQCQLSARRLSAGARAQGWAQGWTLAGLHARSRLLISR